MSRAELEGKEFLARSQVMILARKKAQVIAQLDTALADWQSILANLTSTQDVAA